MKVTRLHSHRLTRLLAVGLAAGALAAPAASAMPAGPDAIQTGTAEQIAIEPEPAPVVQTVDTRLRLGLGRDRRRRRRRAAAARLAGRLHLPDPPRPHRGRGVTGSLAVGSNMRADG